MTKRIVATEAQRDKQFALMQERYAKMAVIDAEYYFKFICEHCTSTNHGYKLMPICFYCDHVNPGPENE